MKNVILLDLDGVLIITPSWKQDLIHIDGYSDFNEKLLENFNTLIKNVTAEIWLTSSRRNNKTLSEFNEIFKNRKVVKKLEGFIPQGTGGKERLAEINAFLDHEPVKNFLIIDDDNSLQNLEARRKQYWVKTSSLIGFDSERLIDAFSKLKNWT
ncbi:HAD domain-containing protein [Ferruginibacter sp.]